MKTLFSIIRTVAHPLKGIVILKLPNLVLCPFPAIMTELLGGEGRREKGKKRGKSFDSDKNRIYNGVL